MAMTVRARRYGGTAVRRYAGICMAAASLTVCGSVPAVAQADTGRGEPWIVSVSSYGKWIALAGSASLTAVAILRNDDADQIFRGLLALCRSAPAECELDGNGRYRSQDAERLYQETVRLDGQARAWMIAGQLTLAAAGGMFLLDLVTGNDEPKNIPYTPFEVISEPRSLGFRVRF